MTRALAGLCLLVAACSAPEPPAAAVPTSQADDVRRLVAILDYVAADYGGAVVDGQVVNEAEYEEQIVFLEDAGAIAARLPAVKELELEADLAKIAALVGAKAPASEVADASRGLGRRVLAAHGVVLAPAATPSRERAAPLYAQNCAICHGVDGRGDGPAAARLDPPPPDFHDPEYMAALSPARAYSMITDGNDTAMASFQASFSSADRWSLAFYVFTLRHDAAERTRGADAYRRARGKVAATATRLAGITDGELEASLAAAGLDDAARSDALAYLRAEAAFEATGAPLDGARRLLQGAVASYRAGDPAAATVVNAAYLDGFEPYEAALRAHDPELVRRLEARFFAIREMMQARAPADEVEREVLRAGAMLDRADEILAGGSGARVAFVGAMLVILREGVEAALLIMLLLGLARRGGVGRDVSAVHAGWGSAVLLGVVTWFASGPLVRLGGARRELMEGVLALSAAVVLLWAGHWVLARLDAKRRVDALRRRFAEASPARRRWVLFGLGFVAVYREAFEVVLFLRAIALDADRVPTAVVGGAAAGAAALVVVMLLLSRVGRRLRPGTLLTASGTLLCALAVILAGKGVRALQEAGVLGISPLSLPRIEWLGLFPSWQGVLAQLLVLGAFALIAALALVRARRTTAL